MAKDAQIIVKLSADKKDKLAFIAWHDRETITDIVTAGIDKHLAAFEKKHGPITDEQLKEARIK